MKNDLRGTTYFSFSRMTNITMISFGVLELFDGSLLSLAVELLKSEVPQMLSFRLVKMRQLKGLQLIAGLPNRLVNL